MYIHPGKILKDVVSQCHLANFYPYELLWYRGIKTFSLRSNKYIYLDCTEKLASTCFMSPYWFGSAIYESFSTAQNEKKCIHIHVFVLVLVLAKSAYAKMQYGKIQHKKWKNHHKCLNEINKINIKSGIACKIASKMNFERKKNITQMQQQKRQQHFMVDINTYGFILQ